MRVNVLSFFMALIMLVCGSGVTGAKNKSESEQKKGETFGSVFTKLKKDPIKFVTENFRSVVNFCGITYLLTEYIFDAKSKTELKNFRKLVIVLLVACNGMNGLPIIAL